MVIRQYIFIERAAVWPFLVGKFEAIRTSTINLTSAIILVWVKADRQNGNAGEKQIEIEEAYNPVRSGWLNHRHHRVRAFHRKWKLYAHASSNHPSLTAVSKPVENAFQSNRERSNILNTIIAILMIKLLASFASALSNTALSIN